MSKSQNLKSKFRASAKWRKWRSIIAKRYHCIDYITNKKLISGFNVHHLDLRDEHYKDLTDEKRFLACNKLTHKFLHWIYTYWKSDKKILDRIEEVLTEMERYSND